MNPDIAHFGTVFASFFAIMNPFANTPVFLSLTEEMDAKTTRQVASRALLLAFVIVSAFAASGHFILEFFGITLAAFQIAGGILVALVGFNLLHGEHSSVQKPKDEHLADSGNAVLGIAVSPLAMPLLAGPGTLVTGMNFAAGGSVLELGIVLVAFFVVCLLCYACFVSGKAVTRFLGKNFIMVISRIMGLILAVVGTQMLIEGLKGAFKGG
ncbi:MAG: MarC family protein [Verrucomicrobiota bacterium]